MPVFKDYTPDEYSILEMIRNRFQSVFETYGYQNISLPIIESSDLFLQKLGDRFKSQIYTFKDHQGMELALRPEITSSVIRYYLSQSENNLMSSKYSYSGKVFRNLQDRNDYHEFTHIGTEWIGIESILSDAESIRMACRCLEEIGISDYRLTLGNLGIITHLVNHLDVDLAFKNFFLENLRRKDKDPDFFIKTMNDILNYSAIKDEYKDIFNILKKLSVEEEKTLLTKLLHMIHPHFSEDLDEAEDVVEGILTKIKRQNQYESIQKIIDFSFKLQNICEAPSQAISKAKSLLKDYHIKDSHINNLELICESLISMGIQEKNIIIDFSLGRNLQYYTGTVFEIDIPSSSKTFCGGGRYDDLIKKVDNEQSISAFGFAFHLDKLLEICLNKSNCNIPIKSIDIYCFIEGDVIPSALLILFENLRRNKKIVYTEFSQHLFSEMKDHIINRKPNVVVIYNKNMKENQLLIFYPGDGSLENISIEDFKDKWIL